MMVILSKSVALVVQWIGRKLAELAIEVRFLAGAQFITWSENSNNPMEQKRDLQFFIASPSNYHF